MEFKVKIFAQLMILNHEVALIFDDITNGDFNIDSYEIAEHPEMAQAALTEAMNQAYDISMKMEEYRTIYEVLYGAGSDDTFSSLLKKKNDSRRGL
jgi:hypothetical protein